MKKSNDAPRQKKRSPLSELPSSLRAAGFLVSIAKAASLILLAVGTANGLVCVLEDRLSEITLPLICLAVGTVLRTVATFADNQIYTLAAAREKHAIRVQATRQLAAIDHSEVGSTTSLLTYGVNERDNYYTAYLPAYIDSFIIPIFILVCLYIIDWVSGVIVTLTLPLIPIFMILVGKYTKDQTAAALDALTRFANRLTELARGLPVLMGLGRADEQAASIKQLSEKLQHKNMETLRTALLSALVLELIATISVAVVAVFIGVRLLHGDIPLAIGLMALLLAPECFAPFRQVGNAYHASSTGLVALQRIKELFATSTKNNNRHLRNGKKLVLQNVSVRYEGREISAFENLSYVAPSKGAILLQGKSGSGKTTLIHAILGNLPSSVAVEGRIEVPHSYAWLPQHPIFSQPTVQDELRLYTKKQDQSQIIKKLRLDALLQADPEQLSPGEQRRVAFAGVYLRAMTRDCIVLLDEPTAHVDRQTAKYIIRAIRQLKRKTVVVIASHDPSAQALADDIIAFDDTLPMQKPHAIDAPTTRIAKTHQTATEAPSLRRPLYLSLRQLLSGSWKKYLSASLLGVLAAVFAISLTALSGWLIVRASEQPPVLYLMVAIVGVRFFGIGRALLYYWSRLAIHDAVFSSATALRVRLWNGLARKGPAFRALLSAGNTMDRVVRDSDRVQELLPRLLLPVVSFVIVSVCLGATIVVLLPSALLFTIVVQLLLSLALIASAIMIQRYSRQQFNAESQLTVQLTRLIENHVQARANGYLSALQKEVISASNTLRQLATRQALLRGGFQGFSVCIIYAYAVGLLLIAANSHEVLGPVLAVILLAPLGLLPLLSDAVTAIQQWPLFTEVLRRTDRITHIDFIEGDVELKKTPVEMLALNHIGYQYPGTQQKILSDITISVDSNRWLLVTGPSGSGKSTLLALLLKNIQPTEGIYTLDGQDSREVAPASIRENIVWCPQESHLFNSSIRANLLIARSRSDIPSDTEINTVLDRVGLLPVVNQMEHGLDTNIGSEGHKLSGGQRQRLALARTLLTKAGVVLLDEPTAHLDEAASVEIVRDLHDIFKKKLVVLVSHEDMQLTPNIAKVYL